MTRSAEKATAPEDVPPPPELLELLDDEPPLLVVLELVLELEIPEVVPTPLPELDTVPEASGPLVPEPLVVVALPLPLPLLEVIAESPPVELALSPALPD
jgi:hypothetical protein